MSSNEDPFAEILTILEKELELYLEEAPDVESDDDGHEITCATEDFNAVSEVLEAQFGAPSESGLVWKPQNTIEVGETQASTLLKLLDTLDDNDDVQNIASNFDISEDVLARLA